MKNTVQLINAIIRVISAKILLTAALVTSSCNIEWQAPSKTNEQDRIHRMIRIHLEPAHSAMTGPGSWPYPRAVHSGSRVVVTSHTVCARDS